MRPYTLKRDILYHAIQGKLVPHDSTEGTGQNLVSENKKRKLDYSLDIQKRIGKGCKPIQESELPFDIPESWAWERFGNLVINYDSQRRPVTKSDRRTTKGLYDYYGATGAIDKVDEYIFDGEFLMIGEDGGNFFVDRDNSFIARGTFWANNHVHVVQPIVCDIGYLKVCLDAYDLPNLGLINGIAVPKLNQENMNSICVPIPPLAEQKRIVAKIEELLPLIERYEKAWSRLEDFNKRFPVDMQKSILQMAIQGKLVEQRPEEGTGEELYRRIQTDKQALIKAGKIIKEKPLPEITEDEIPFEIPESWKWVRLSAVTDMLSGFAFKSEDFKTEGKYRLLRGINLGVNDVRWKETVYVDAVSDRVRDYRLTSGDVLLGLDRPWISEGTRVTIFNEEEKETYLVQRVLRIRGLSGVTSSFVALLLQSSLLKDPLGGETTGISVPHISPNQVGSIVVPLPPLAEQKRIVARLEELLPLCERLK